MKIRLFPLLGATILFFFAGSAAFSDAPVENKGAAEIKISAGTRGTVQFPHKRHQDKIEDCKICHALYPEEAGIIEKLKAEGTLKKKQVMNIQCTKCHKQKKREGIKAGPTTCTKCHIKD